MTRKENDRRGLNIAWINGGFVVVAALIGGFFTWYGQQPAPPPEAAPKTVEQLLAESPVSLPDWQAMVDEKYLSTDERTAALRDLVGETMTWAGYFKEFNHSQYDPTPGNTYCLIMYDSRESLEKSQSGAFPPPPMIRCWFGARAKRQLDELEPGEVVVVRGMLTNPILVGSLLGTELSKGEILGVGGDRLASVAGQVLRK